MFIFKILFLREKSGGGDKPLTKHPNPGGGGGVEGYEPPTPLEN